MFLEDVSLIYRIDVLISVSNEDFLADLDTGLLTLRHKEKIDGLYHNEEQLSKINWLKFQYLIVFFFDVESLDMVETLSTFLQLYILRC